MQGHEPQTHPVLFSTQGQGTFSMLSPEPGARVYSQVKSAAGLTVRRWK